MLYYIKILFTLLFVVSAVVRCVWAQSDVGKITGEIREGDKTPVEFAKVFLLQGDAVRGAVETDENGRFSFANVSPGTYNVRVSHVGQVKLITGIVVKPNVTVPLGTITVGTVTTETVDVIAYKEPLFEKDETVQGHTVTNEEFQKMGTRSINTALATGAGVYQRDDGGALSIRGGRTEQSQYYVDGVRVIGQLGLSQKAISQAELITGGTPAQYGDLTSGAIAITTSSPSSYHSVGLEYVTSELTDAYGYNLGQFSASGPLWRTKNKKDPKAERLVRLGYFFGAEYENVLDPSPSGIGVYKLRDGLLADFENRPLQLSQDGLSLQSRANFVRNSDLVRVKAKQNSKLNSIRANLRLDFQVDTNAILKLGANFARSLSDQWSLTNSLFAPGANSIREDQTVRTFIRFQQTFPGKPSSLLRNLSYSLQADFTIADINGYDRRHKYNTFNYGYIGKFTSEFVPIYELITPGSPGHRSDLTSEPHWQTAGFFDNNYQFDGSNSPNPILARYNEQIYEYLRNNPRTILDFSTFQLRQSSNVRGFNDLEGNLNGLLNGNANALQPNLNIYSLFTGMGLNAGSWFKFRSEVVRVSGNATAEIGKKRVHNISVGFEFDQRFERQFSVSAGALYALMRQLSLQTVTGVDRNRPYIGGEFRDTVFLPVELTLPPAGNFMANFANAVGGINTNTIPQATDFYDPAWYEANGGLKMFSVDELISIPRGGGYVSYYGFDYTGNRTGSVARENFFTDIKNRPLNAYTPTYIAGYIQDKFEVDKMFFNVGLRVDRFDANLPVLKDKYSLYPTYTVKETEQAIRNNPGGNPDFTLPSFVGEDWVAYVNDRNNPTEIRGYRDGDTWYDANGSPASPSVIGRGSPRPLPHFKQDSISLESFTDYAPKTLFLPRISFSFPISDEANFFAHYDVLAQRPLLGSGAGGAANQANYLQYLYLKNAPTNSVDNPNLFPTRTVDFELGFKQKLSNYMAFSASAFYREMRDMLQTFNYRGAYPFDYTSIENLDFGTVKGFNFSLDLRRQGLVRMNVSYSLQFANGTGSSFNSSRNISNNIEGFSAIRVLLPFSFDQRHTIAGNMDIRWLGDKKGPVFKLGGKEFAPLHNFGINLTWNIGSGTPYTTSFTPDVAAVQFGLNSTAQTFGTPFSKRLPFNYRFDLRIDRDFIWIRSKKDNEGKEVSSRPLAFNVYVIFLNALNTRNVFGVYQFSGLPDDSGMLNSALGQLLIDRQIDRQSFIDLYRVREQNPGNFSLPRRIRLGLMFNL